MKTLSDYIADMTNSQEIDMKPMHIMAEQVNGKEALWNTTDDRWSRKAKHHLKLSSKIEDHVWEEGDTAIYENQQVEIKNPNGPNSTVGIAVGDKIIMVRESKLKKLDEQSMMTPLAPLNRMMQLAGISKPVILGEENNNSELLDEANTTSVFDGLYRANSSGEFRNNPIAARLATIGQIMTGLEDQIKEIREEVEPNLLNRLDAVVGIGASLINSAKDMLKA